MPIYQTAATIVPFTTLLLPFYSPSIMNHLQKFLYLFNFVIRLILSLRNSSHAKDHRDHHPL